MGFKTFDGFYHQFLAISLTTHFGPSKTRQGKLEQWQMTILFSQTTFFFLQKTTNEISTPGPVRVLSVSEKEPFDSR